ncbi:DUF1254 domain-containing protein [Kitasatospora sp. NPDC098663]|uniref:DUF1254 domain-containing protein n=1 Tax=Kitasatospora sp. NPDC098663 TaxID=3364096 RepID=UPI00380BF803
MAALGDEPSPSLHPYVSRRAHEPTDRQIIYTLRALGHALRRPRTNTGWIIGRIEVKNDADVANVQDLQKQLGLVPLSAWGSGTYTPPDGTVDPSVDMVTAPPQQVAELSGRDFLNRLCSLLVDNPTTPDDAPAMAEFATIGIVPGGNVDTLSDADLDAAVTTAQSRIQNHPGPAPVNGWQFAPTDIGTYGTDYEQRAHIAMTGLGAVSTGQGSRCCHSFV